MVITARVVSLSMNSRGEKTTTLESKDSLYTSLTQTFNIPGDEFNLGDEVKITAEKI